MKRQPTYWLLVLVMVCGVIAGEVHADSLFKDRQIYLSIDKNRTFTVGVTGTTAGYNFIALVENAKQESISLSELGYWERVADPPSFLRNYDLQLIVKNQASGRFKLEFEYDRQQQDIGYRIVEGAVDVRLDHSEYYPALIITSIAPAAPVLEADGLPSGARRVLFFDFNSFDVDLRKYYGRVKGLLSRPEYTPHFYYYEASNYNSYYFKTLQTVERLDMDKMGLSLEDGTLGYYQKVLDNLKSRMGTDFADQIIIVSRFGKKYSEDIRQYAYEIGMDRKTVITLWSYEDIR